MLQFGVQVQADSSHAHNSSVMLILAVRLVIRHLITTITGTVVTTGGDRKSDLVDIRLIETSHSIVVWAVQWRKPIVLDILVRWRNVLREELGPTLVVEQFSNARIPVLNLWSRQEIIIAYDRTRLPLPLFDLLDKLVHVRARLPVHPLVVVTTDPRTVPRITDSFKDDLVDGVILRDSLEGLDDFANSAIIFIDNLVEIVNFFGFISVLLARLV